VVRVKCALLERARNLAAPHTIAHPVIRVGISVVVDAGPAYKVTLAINLNGKTATGALHVELALAAGNVDNLGSDSLRITDRSVLPRFPGAPDDK
jgi:hypothetical protein